MTTAAGHRSGSAPGPARGPAESVLDAAIPSVPVWERILPVLCRGGGCAGARVDRGYLAVERGLGRVQQRGQHGPRVVGYLISIDFRCSPRSAFNRGLGAAALVLAAVVVFEPALAAGLYHARGMGECNDGRRGDGHCGLAGPGVPF